MDTTKIIASKKSSDTKQPDITVTAEPCTAGVAMLWRDYPNHPDRNVGSVIKDYEELLRVINEQGLTLNPEFFQRK